MKKLIISLAIGTLLLLVSFQNAKAQVVLETVTIKPNATKAVISEKVSNSFSHLFKDAKDAQWFEVNKRFVVNFILNDQKNKAVFTKDGELIYQLSFSSEKNIPEEILKKVQDQYQGYTLSTAVKINTGSNIIWVMNIENHKQILVIRATDEEIGMIDRIRKT